jgi:hypothetical protein
MPSSEPQELKDLRDLLQTAIEIEHATIPAYLSALYSIHDGTNVEAAAVIRSVVMEEMLHLTLAANVLNAVGGQPSIDAPDFVPKYPKPLPHSNGAFQVELLPFSPKAVGIFLQIELPAARGAPPEPGNFKTIGQFYEAIDQKLVALTKQYGEPTVFSGLPGFQVRPEHWYYGGGGQAVVVTNLTTAQLAIAEIKEQGEGMDHGIFDDDQRFGQRDELAHYFRFNELNTGRRYVATDTPASGPTGDELLLDWSAVHPMRPNPKASDYVTQPEIHALMMDFNRTYSGLLKVLHTAFNGRPDLLMNAVPAMYQLKYKAQALMKIPSGQPDGSTVGPSFEYVP